MDTEALDRLTEICNQLQPHMNEIDRKAKVEMSDLRSIMKLVPVSTRHWVCCPKRLKMSPAQFGGELKRQIAISLGLMLSN